jgi:hypothetical protein
MYLVLHNYYVWSYLRTYVRRAVARSENPEGLVVLGGENVPPLVKIGLTKLPKTGGA